MNTITIIESDGTSQTITSTTEFSTISGTLSDGTIVTLFPIAPVVTPTPESNPVVEVDVKQEDGTETVLNA